MHFLPNLRIFLADKKPHDGKIWRCCRVEFPLCRLVLDLYPALVVCLCVCGCVHRGVLATLADNICVSLLHPCGAQLLHLYKAQIKWLLWLRREWYGIAGISLHKKEYVFSSRFNSRAEWRESTVSCKLFPVPANTSWQISVFSTKIYLYIHRSADAKISCNSWDQVCFTANTHTGTHTYVLRALQAVDCSPLRHAFSDWCLTETRQVALTQLQCSCGIDSARRPKEATRTAIDWP